MQIVKFSMRGRNFFKLLRVTSNVNLCLVPIPLRLKCFTPTPPPPRKETKGVPLTGLLFPRARVGYEMLDSQRGASTALAIIISSNKHE